MRSTAKAIKAFFSGFGLPAYSVDTVPDDVEAPYISYYFSEPEHFEKASGYAQVWYRTKSNTDVFTKADAILGAIEFGKRIELDTGGYLIIYPESPKGQLMTDKDYRAAVINFSVNSYHMPGL